MRQCSNKANSPHKSSTRIKRTMLSSLRPCSSFWTPFMLIQLAMLLWRVGGAGFVRAFAPLPL